VACGTCEERCPVGAIAVNHEDVAVVDEARCMGCGVCTPSCPSDAVDLTLREEVKPPPALPEFIARRLKTS
jgi:Na+-translocating ferredoxin:NAD+ oxidoreductase subunit B